MTNEKEAYITTYTGKTMNLLDPQPEDICLEDIARALSLTTRFGGHTVSPLSVAQHSIQLCQTVSKENRLYALLHDAAEAYVGDMQSPLKVLIPQFSEVEDKILSVILTKYGLDPVLPEEVLGKDKRAAIDEAKNFFVQPPGWAVGGLSMLACLDFSKNSTPDYWETRYLRAVARYL